MINIKYIGNHALLVNCVPCDRGVKELIQIIVLSTLNLEGNFTVLLEVQ